MSNEQGSSTFFSALFDFSFSQFVTTRIIKVLYALGMIGVTLWSLFLIFGGLTQGGAAAVGALLLAVLGFFIGLIYLRVLLEFIVIVFRIGENTSLIARNTEGGFSATRSPAAPPTSGGFGTPSPAPEEPPPGPAQ